MSAKAMSLKEKIKNYAKSNKIAAQVVLQNYMFERFLERLSVSEYSEKFVVKGGMLIAAIVGLDTRSTMDLDTTLKNLPLKEEQILTALTSICEIDLEDDVSFEIKSVSMIRKGGYIWWVLCKDRCSLRYNYYTIIDRCVHRRCDYTLCHKI